MAGVWTRGFAGLLAAALAGGFGAGAAAQEAAPVAEPAAGLISEVRFGAFAHDVTYNREPGVDLNGEILFRRLDFFDLVGTFRPHLGGMINTAGATSQVYAGLSWTVDLTANLFVEGGVGGAIHTGELEANRADRKGLGSRVLFRVAGTIGWRFDEHHSLSATWGHISNADLADPNEGLDVVGLRYGYRF